MTDANSIASQQTAQRAGRITRENLAAMKSNAALVKPTPQSFLKKLSDGVQEGFDYLTQLSTMTVKESKRNARNSDTFLKPNAQKQLFQYVMIVVAR